MSDLPVLDQLISSTSSDKDKSGGTIGSVKDLEEQLSLLFEVVFVVNSNE